MPATLSLSSLVGVVLCPPHPLYGGCRNDTRIVRVARELAIHNISTLSIDYGSYGGGAKEVRNVLDAIFFIRGKVKSLGLLGYSFGAVAASNAAARTKVDGYVGISILERVNSLKANLSFNCPKLLVHGRHDTLAPYSKFEHLYSKAKGRKAKLVVDTDHFYMDKYPAVIDSVAKGVRRFFEDVLSR